MMTMLRIGEKLRFYGSLPLKNGFFWRKNHKTVTSPPPSSPRICYTYCYSYRKEKNKSTFNSPCSHSLWIFSHKIRLLKGRLLLFGNFSQHGEGVPNPIFFKQGDSKRGVGLPFEKNYQKILYFSWSTTILSRTQRPCSKSNNWQPHISTSLTGLTQSILNRAIISSKSLKNNLVAITTQEIASRRTQSFFACFPKVPTTGFLASCRRREQRQFLNWWTAPLSWQSGTLRRMPLMLPPSRTDS